MLTEEAIRKALHASRFVPLAVANPHGPLGLEQLAAVIAVFRVETQSNPLADRMRRPNLLDGDFS